jgi:hypothetical protein
VNEIVAKADRFSDGADAVDDLTLVSLERTALMFEGHSDGPVGQATAVDADRAAIVNRS